MYDNLANVHDKKYWILLSGFTAYLHINELKTELLHHYTRVECCIDY